MADKEHDHGVQEGLARVDDNGGEAEVVRADDGVVEAEVVRADDGGIEAGGAPVDDGCGEEGGPRAADGGNVEGEGDEAEGAGAVEGGAAEQAIPIADIMHIEVENQPENADQPGEGDEEIVGKFARRIQAFREILFVEKIRSFSAAGGLMVVSIILIYAAFHVHFAAGIRGAGVYLLFILGILFFFATMYFTLLGCAALFEEKQVNIGRSRFFEGVVRFLNVCGCRKPLSSADPVLSSDSNVLSATSDLVEISENPNNPECIELGAVKMPLDDVNILEAPDNLQLPNDPLNSENLPQIITVDVHLPNEPLNDENVSADVVNVSLENIDDTQPSTSARDC